jgi:hypothetical protein
MKWGWLFRTYVQWHAIAFLLSELCIRTKGEAVERAWRALEATAGRWWFPLNDASPHRKGQQGCLWKPLKKLLAKAKAARDRELTLERASHALRNGQQFYSGFASIISQPPPVSVDQPGSEKLDRMLRPFAPKLGGSPLQSMPSWPSSPSMVQPQDSSTGDSGDSGQQTQQPNGRSSSGIHRSRGSPGQEFQDLSSFGLDNVINDVMGTMSYEGTDLYDFNSLQPTRTITNVSHQSQPMQMPNATTNTTPPTLDTAPGTYMNGTQGTFGDPQLFANVDFSTVSPEIAQNMNGQLTDSPNLDGGVMDWTQWDDLVNQYGSSEGLASNPNGNPASNGGLIHWF